MTESIPGRVFRENVILIGKDHLMWLWDFRTVNISISFNISKKNVNHCRNLYGLLIKV